MVLYITYLFKYTLSMLLLLKFIHVSSQSLKVHGVYTKAKKHFQNKAALLTGSRDILQKGGLTRMSQGGISRCQKKWLNKQTEALSPHSSVIHLAYAPEKVSHPPTKTRESRESRKVEIPSNPVLQTTRQDDFSFSSSPNSPIVQPPYSRRDG